jgi:hypothetical protein
MISLFRTPGVSCSQMLCNARGTPPQFAASFTTQLMEVQVPGSLECKFPGDHGGEHPPSKCRPGTQGMR